MNSHHIIHTGWFVLMAIVACGAEHLHAAEPVLLRASLAKPGPVLVGERVIIRVELLTTTTFASAPVFDLPTISGALLMQIEDRPVLGTAEIDGESYAVQQHELALFVMRPGVAQVPSFTVRLESPPRFGEKPDEHRLTTPALQVEARMPAGAENLAGLIATQELHVHQTWQPQPTKAHVGDAFTRTVTLTAPAVPGMVFPPLPLAKVDGLAVYSKPPVVQDQIERSDFTGERIDTVTYICEHPGQFTLPALVIPWWDLKNQKLMQATLPAVTLEVAPGPAASVDAAAAGEEAPGWPWLGCITGAVLLLAAAVAATWRQGGALLAAWERSREQRQGSEAALFARVLDTCRASEVKATYDALLRWLDSTHHGPEAATIGDFLGRHPDADLRRQVEALQESFLGRATDWNGVALADALRRARRKDLHWRIATDKARLPALNPPWISMLLVVAFFPCLARGLVEAATTMANPTYVGGQVCEACHPREAERWKGSDHALAMQPANSATVLGNFDNAIFEKDGVTSTFFSRDGEYFVRTDGPDGQLHEYKIAYTFGVDPLQQYLIAFPNGRYQALSIAWDSRPTAAGGQRWFHLYPHEKIDHRDILHWTGPLQNWNFMCADCHSTNLQKGYRLAEDRYQTTWSDIDVSCEACHGPGSRHVEWAQGSPSGRSDPDPTHGLVALLKDTSGGVWTFPPGEAIARRTKPPSSRAEVETCGRCHARRAQVWGDYQPGQPLEQSYHVALLDESLYHADGQIRDEVYEYGSFLQSKMYQAGVTCSDCHDPHSGHLRAQGNALCAHCHLPAKYDGPQHHFHKADIKGGQCVSCHMIERFYMVIDGRRDHSFRVPRPDLSVKVGTPNACTDCHGGRTAQWAADAVVQWYGPQRKGGWHYGEAIDAGQHARTDAERLLVQTVENTTLPAIVRATALNLLPRYLSPQSFRVVEPSLRDHDPLVRRAAAAALSAVEPRARATLGVPLLRDPIRTVRLETVSSLVDVPRHVYSPDQLATLDQVIAEYRQVQAFNADRAEAQVNLGALDARLGNSAAAEGAYRAAIRLQPAFIPAYINLADLYRQQGQEDMVAQTLRAALQADPANGAAYHALGLSLVRQQRLRDAIPELAQAARLRPDVPRYAYVYGVALHEAGQVQQALQVLTEAHQRHPADRDILAALVEYHRQAGDRQAAIAWARKLVEVSPGDVQARRLLDSLERER